MLSTLFIFYQKTFYTFVHLILASKRRRSRTLHFLYPYRILNRGKNLVFSAVSSSIANGSSASSSTYIRSQYNLNPPPLNIINANNTSLTMDLSLTSPDDLPPLPGYDPSLTCTAPSDGPPSTIGDADVSHSGAGSILGISASGAIPAQPPQVPPTYLSSAMSTSSGDSSSHTASSNHNNLNARRQSSGSHSSSHLRSFSNQPKSKISRIFRRTLDV